MRRAVFLVAAALAGTASAAQQPKLASSVVAEVLILFGAVFILAAALGMLRFPDFYTRLHASTKLVTLGGIGIFGGSAAIFASIGAAERVLLIAAFFVLTAPLSGYMIARAGYLGGLRPYFEESSADEWQELGSMRLDGSGAAEE